MLNVLKPCHEVLSHTHFSGTIVPLFMTKIVDELTFYTFASGAKCICCIGLASPSKIYCQRLYSKGIFCLPKTTRGEVLNTD